MKKTKIVNIMGGPGAGKTTITAGVFHLLKVAGKEVETTEEYAKDLVWEKRQETFNDSMYVFAKQFHSLYIRYGKIDYIVTDRPLIQSNVYHGFWQAPLYPDKWNETFYKMVKETWDLYDNEVYFINRCIPYNHNGRNESEEEAKQQDILFKQNLIDLNIPFMELDGDKDAPQKIFDDLMRKEEKK